MKLHSKVQLHRRPLISASILLAIGLLGVLVAVGVGAFRVRPQQGASRGEPHVDHVVSFECIPDGLPANARELRWGLLSQEDQQKVASALQHAVEVYPAGFLELHLDRICVVQDLFIRTIPVAGTWFDRTIVVNTKLAGRFLSEEFIAETIHHELSSVLLSRYPESLNEAKWRQLIPAEVRYTEIAVYRPSASTVSTEEWLNKGFLHEYASLNFEEDFNAVAQVLLANPERAWRLANQFPRFGEKVHLAARFYCNLESRLCEYLHLARGGRGE